MEKTTKREQVIKAAKLSIYSNTLLVCIKMLVGIFTGSVSILSEAIHSGIDLTAAVIANVSVRKASNPPVKTICSATGNMKIYPVRLKPP